MLCYLFGHKPSNFENLDMKLTFYDFDSKTYFHTISCDAVCARCTVHFTYTTHLSAKSIEMHYIEYVSKTHYKLGYDYGCIVTKSELSSFKGKKK